MSEFKFPDEQDDQKTVDTAELDNEVKITEPTDEVEIEVIDDTPEKDKGRKPLDREVAEPTEQELEDYSEGVKKRIKELTHARHDERRAKEALAREKAELEAFAKRIHAENQQLRQYVTSGSEQYAASQVQLAESEVEAAKRKYREAYEAGDAEKLVEAQEALTEAKLKVQSAKNFRPPALQAEEKEVQLPQTEVSRPQMDDKTLRWQAKNQWFGAPGYEEMTSFALGLHQKLVNTGVDPRSDDYFERIDARMKSTFREFFGEEDKPKSGDGSKKPTTVVAPATRSTGPRKVQLTQHQVNLAKKFGLTPQQYAAQVALLEKSNG